MYFLEPVMDLGPFAGLDLVGEVAFWERVSAVFIFLVFGFNDWVLAALPFALIYLGLLASGVRGAVVYGAFGALAFTLCIYASDAMSGGSFFLILSQGAEPRANWLGLLRLVLVGATLGLVLWLFDRSRSRQREREER
jgi:hypothetical protein